MVIPLYAQQNEKLENLIEVFENYKEDSDLKLSNLDNSSFNNILKLTYEAIEASPSEFLPLIAEDKSFGAALGGLLRTIPIKYSYFLENIILIPIFVKAKIISRKEVNKGKFRQLNLMLEPEKILKGKESFLYEKQFEVFFREYEHVPDSLDFKIGKTYLFPLWDRNEEKNQMFAIATWIDKIGGRFLIEDGYLYDRNEFFNLGKKVSWEKFVDEFELMVKRIIGGYELEIYKGY